MSYSQSQYSHRLISKFALILVGFGLTLGNNAVAQTSSSPTQPSSQQPDTPAAGGPQGDIGPIAVPKKKPEEEKPKPKPEKVKNPEGLEDFSIRVNTQLVNVDVSVLTKDGQFIPGLKKENFRILEDGVPQKVERVTQTEAPITAVMLLEFANPNRFANKQVSYDQLIDMLNASYLFVQSLKPEDYVSVISYDIKPTIRLDFTKDKRQVLGALGQMRMPQFSETNMFDALYETIDRIEGIEGRKYIVLICSGYDSFSKLTLDKIYAKVKSTRDITIYAVGTGGAIRALCPNCFADRYGGEMDFLQADNQLKSFATMTGGRAYFPRFIGEMPEIFRDVAQTIRNQYLISYYPTNQSQDGTYRKIKVELGGENGGPLLIQDQKGKKIKYQVIARDGYRARTEVQ
jgi:VWFA-related protein